MQPPHTLTSFLKAKTICKKSTTIVSLRAIATIETLFGTLSLIASQKACLMRRLILFRTTAQPIFFVTTIPKLKKAADTLFKMQNPRSIEGEYFESRKVLLHFRDISANRKFTPAFCSSAGNHLPARCA